MVENTYFKKSNIICYIVKSNCFYDLKNNPNNLLNIQKIIAFSLQRDYFSPMIVRVSMLLQSELQKYKPGIIKIAQVADSKIAGIASSERNRCYRRIVDGVATIGQAFSTSFIWNFIKHVVEEVDCLPWVTEFNFSINCRIIPRNAGAVCFILHSPLGIFYGAFKDTVRLCVDFVDFHLFYFIRKVTVSIKGINGSN